MAGPTVTALGTPQSGVETRLMNVDLEDIIHGTGETFWVNSMRGGKIFGPRRRRL